MNKIKRILSIFPVIIMLFCSLPMNVFAENGIVGLTVEDTIYETGNTYSVNGVDYLIEENESVTVKGPALKGVPEKVEILSELGGFTVTTIGYGAFYNCETVKEVIVPETVTTISEWAFIGSGLTEIEIKGKNVNIKTSFRDTPLFSESVDKWKNDVLFVSGYAIVSYAQGKVVFTEDVIGISECCFKYSNSATDITILNPDCYIPDSPNVFRSHATIYGYKNSSAHKHAEKYGNRFSMICKCEDTVFIPATNSYCNGVVGYGEGNWCESCNIYSSGGLIDTIFDHVDLDEDNLCDFCKLSTDSEISNAGKCGDQAVWTLSGNGVLHISGTGDVYAYDNQNREPWYNYRNEIKTFIADEGMGRLHGISFKGYQNLETVTMGDSVLSIPSSFENCTALKNVTFPKYSSAIPSYCFAGCASLESVNIPKNVTVIGGSAFRKCTSLSDIDFETGYVELKSGAFYGTAAYNNPDNIKDGFLYIDNCLIMQITPGVTTLVLGPEITSIASGWETYIDLKVTSVVVYNTDCVFPSHTGAVPYEAILKGYVGSTTWFYSKNFSADFEALEPHTHTEIIDIPAVMPTDTKPGYTHQSVCAVCGEIVAKRERIDPNEYDILVKDDVVTAHKFDAATSEADGTDITITFTVLHDVCTSNIKQTVIYKVGEVKLSKTTFTYNGKVQKPDVTVKDSKGKALTLNRDYKLTYSANSKYSGKYSVKVDYIGNYAGSDILDYCIVINPVTPMISASDTESITLCWKKGHSDLVYRVYSVDITGKITKIADTKNGSYVVTSLEADTQYRFQVRAYVKGEDGKTYWGEKGDTFICSTKSNKGIINLLKNLIARLMAILQKFSVKT